MGVIGYFEGTDPMVLANLSIAGHSTIPLGNGFDNHGRYLGHITKDENISVIVGYFHKVMPPHDVDMSIEDIMANCIKLQIPVLLICGQEFFGHAKELLGDMAERIRLTTPDKTEAAILDILRIKKK